jgi:hypothetical protein
MTRRQKQPHLKNDPTSKMTQRQKQPTVNNDPT